MYRVIPVESYYCESLGLKHREVEMYYLQLKIFIKIPIFFSY